MKRDNLEQLRGDFYNMRCSLMTILVEHQVDSAVVKKINLSLNIFEQAVDSFNESAMISALKVKNELLEAAIKEHKAILLKAYQRLDDE